MTLVNGRRPVTFGQDGSYGHWEWIAAAVLLDLPAGENVIEILNREDGGPRLKILFFLLKRRGFYTAVYLPQPNIYDVKEQCWVHD